VEFAVLMAVLPVTQVKRLIRFVVCGVLAEFMCISFLLVLCVWECVKILRFLFRDNVNLYQF